MSRLSELSGSDGVALRLWGDPAGRPIVFWHALGAVVSGAWFGEVAPLLAERGLHVVAVDGPGFGGSPPLPADRYAVPTLAAMLWSVADRLDLERPVLVGHSWGGTIAVRAAADRPSAVGALVLLDSGHVDYADVPGSNPEATLAERMAAMRAQMRDLPSFDALAAELASEVRRAVTPALLDAVRAGVRIRDDGAAVPIVSPETRAAAMQGAVAERPSESWQVIADAAVPTLLLLATEPAELRAQNTSAAERFRAEIPFADVRFCDGWGHDVIADGGPALADLIGDWLDQTA